MILICHRPLKFAGEVKAQTICPYKVVRNLIFQQIVRVLASFLPHESGEEPNRLFSAFVR